MIIDDAIKAEIEYNMQIDYGIKNAIEHDMNKPDKGRHDTSFRWLDSSADGNAAKMSRPAIATKKDKMSGEFLSISYIKERDMSERTRKQYASYKSEMYDKKYKDRTVSAQELHEQLINDEIIGNLNEITSMPYTSLKYHTLLVCALHYNHKLGRDMQDLYLHCTTEKPKEPYTVIFNLGDLWFIINNDASGAKIGDAAPYFGQTIGRLYNIPLPEFLVDNLRRFCSWSAGLQYLEDALMFIQGQEVV